MNMDRYSRQMLFKPIGEIGQKKLNNSRVAIVGIGALGTVIANHLARSGVGFLRLIDRDFVEKSNLQRQILFDESDASSSLPKAIAAVSKLGKINSDILLEPVVSDLHPFNAEDLLGDIDLIIDGTDNFRTRYLINDVSLKCNVPWIYGGAVASRGMFAAFIPGKTPCYRCLFPNIPSGRGETCDTNGVLSMITDIVASEQAVLALKLLISEECTNFTFTQLDIWMNDEMKMNIAKGKNNDCPACVHENYKFLKDIGNTGDQYSVLCGRDTVQLSQRTDQKIDLHSLTENLRKVGKVEKNPFLVRAYIDDFVFVIFENGRVLIQGTDNIETAKRLYRQYIGN